MASAKLGGKKQDEKHLKLLREMAALASNRHCFECGQRGPTYVNMTIGTFVCTACSGVLRGLNPPHRVKSISMASFTPEEIDFLKEHGNEYNRHVWLGLHDSKSPPAFEPNEEHKLRDYLAQKYERKRWYMEPTADLKEQAKIWNTVSAAPGAPTDATTKPRTGSSLGPAPASAAITASAGTTASPAGTATAVLRLQQPPSGGSPSASATPASAYTTAAPQSSSDLLSDLFAAPAPSAAPAVGSFSAFSGTQAINQPNQPVPFAQAHVTPARAPALLAGHSPQHTGMLLAGGSSGGAAKPPGLSAAATGGDKYAALADLFETSSSSQPPSVRANEAAVNWNSVNWGAVQGAPVPGSSGGIPHQKPPFSMDHAGGWSSTPPSAAPAISSWPSSASTVSPLVAPGLASASFPQPQGANAFHAATSPWAGMQTAAPGGGLSVAAPGGIAANPFLSTTVAASPMPFAAFPGAAGGPSQGKQSGSFAAPVVGPAVPQLAGGPFSQQPQQSGFAVAGGIAGLGPAQPAGVFPAQSGLFGQPASLGGMQVGASVGAQQNGGGWASWSPAQPGPPQARAGTAAHSANPFATPVVGSMPSGNVTNPFL